MKTKNNKGFTLVELIIVIAILGIIMLIALPNVPKILQRQKVKADIITGQKIGQAVRMWYINQKYDIPDESDDKITVSEFEQIIPEDGTIVPVKYSDLINIANEISEKEIPTSFEPDGQKAVNPYYGVFLSTAGYVANIIVTIQDDNSTTLLLGEGEGKIPPDKALYDGTKAGIVYVE